MRKKLFLVVMIFMLFFIATNVSALVEVQINNDTPNKLNLSWSTEEGKTYNVYTCESDDVSTCELLINTEEGEYSIDITDFTKVYHYSVTSCSLNELEENVCEEVESVVSSYAKTKIDDFEIVSNNASTLTLSWEGKENVKEYIVRYKLITDEEYTETRTPDNSITIENLDINGTYSFVVIPIFTVGEEDIESFATVKEYNLSFTIGNVLAQNTSTTSIRLLIDEVKNADGYEIFRSTNATSGYKKIATISTLMYNNTKLTTGTRYYYKVRAFATINGVKLYTGFSNTTSAVPSVVAPKLAITPKTYNSARIVIGKVSGAKGYVIYRSTNPTSGYKQIATTTSTVYEDKKLNPGTTYYYKVKGYSMVKSKKIYGTLSDAFEFYLDLQLPKLAYNTPSRSSLEIVAAGALGVEGYEISLLNGEEVVKTVVGNRVVFNDLEYGEFYNFKAVSYKYVNDEKVLSEPVYLTAQVKPSMPTAVIENQLTFDVQGVTVTVNDLQIDDDVQILVYRSTNPDDGFVMYSEPFQFTNNDQLELEVDSDDDDDPEVIHGPIETFTKTIYNVDLKLRQKYYYRVSVKINGIESKYYTVNRTALTIPKLYIYQNTNRRVYFETIQAPLNDDTVVHYEVWRSTKKNGKYSKVFDKAIVGDDYYCAGGFINGDFNKTYYYKLRYYVVYNGKKVYSGYSNIVKYKNTIRALDKFPVTLSSDYYSILHDMVIKSVSFSIKRNSGNYVYYNMKLNFKSTYSRTKLTSTFWMTFYDWEGDEVADIPVSVSLPKGTKKNWSRTVLIRVPKTAVYYEFD